MRKLYAGVALATLLASSSALADKAIYPSATFPGGEAAFGRVYANGQPQTDANGNWLYSPIAVDSHGQIGTSCYASAIYDASTNGATQLVAAVTGQAVYICGYTLFAGGTANVSLVYGTGSNCATGQTKITPAFQLVAQTGLADSSPFWRGLLAPASQALCLLTSAGVAVQATVYYSQF